MEVEEPISDLGNTSVVQDPVLPEKDTIEDEPVNLEKTIEVENSSLKSNPTESTDGNSTQENTLDNGKKKVKEEKPPTKIVVRRLPPTMTKDQFLEQVSPLPEIDYMYYVHGDVYNNINPYSRAYLNFVNQEDLFSFSRTFDNYVFLDSKGQEYPAIVEFAMFQRVPKQRTKKKDPLMGTIESDPSFIAFKENLLAEALENSKAGGKAIKQHYFETEISTAEEVNTTPLLEYLKVRRAEKARIREERKEEKKRKEIERKLKQKTKDKKGEGDEEESPKDMKVLSSKERRDIKEKENRTIKKKDDKEKPKETRAREFKSRGGKSYQEERLKLAERREEQKKKDMLNSDKRLEVSETNDVSESTDPVTEQSKTEEKSVKVEKRKYDNRRGGKYDDEWKDEKKRNRNDKNNSKRDGRDRKDEYSRRSDRKNSDLDLRRKGKTTRNQDSKYEKRKFTAAQDEEQESKVSPEPLERKEESDIPLKKIRSCDDLRFASVSEATVSTVLSNSDDSSKERKRCSSLENPRSLENQSSLSEVEKLISEKRGKSQKEMKQSEGSCSYRSRKDLSNKKNSSDSKSVSSKKKDRSDDTTEDDPGHKNRGHDDKPEGDIKETGKSKDSSRPDRRIRNKDRPSIEIYRPGMGKFSKQRLEKEKALGSSTEIESPSHSPSPTPKSKLIS